MPLLLALSANSPFWEGSDSGHGVGAHRRSSPSSRASGMPPRYADWEDWVRRMEFMMRSGMVDDHTWFWWDVRIVAGLRDGRDAGRWTVQTRIEHTLGLAALVQALVARARRGRAGARRARRAADENRWQAARHGLEGELVDLPSGGPRARRRPRPAPARPRPRARRGPRRRRRARRRRGPARARHRRRRASGGSTPPTMTSASSSPRPGGRYLDWLVVAGQPDLFVVLQVLRV